MGHRPARDAGTGLLESELLIASATRKTAALKGPRQWRASGMALVGVSLDARTRRHPGGGVLLAQRAPSGGEPHDARGSAAKARPRARRNDRCLAPLSVLRARREEGVGWAQRPKRSGERRSYRDREQVRRGQGFWLSVYHPSVSRHPRKHDAVLQHGQNASWRRCIRPSKRRLLPRNELPIGSTSHPTMPA